MAYNLIVQNVLASELDLALRAAAASLGLLSDGSTHLQRLDDFGSEVGLDQRQVRRYSDKGIKILAQLIVGTWTTTGMPALDVSVRLDGATAELLIATRRLFVIEMRPLAVTLYRGGQVSDMIYRHSDQEADEGWWMHQMPTEPILVDLDACGEEVSVRIVWRGEMWPKFGVRWVTAGRNRAASESLGNTLMLRFPPKVAA